MTANTQIQIRPFSEDDRPALRALISELQSYERELESRRLDVDGFADDYLESLLEECQKKSGVILMASLNEELVGFMCVFPMERLDPQLNEAILMAYISDLMVTASCRRIGVGRMLVVEAEKIAREHGAEMISLNVLARNQLAREFYAVAGFSEYELLLTKVLK